MTYALSESDPGMAMIHAMTGPRNAEPWPGFLPGSVLCTGVGCDKRNGGWIVTFTVLPAEPWLLISEEGVDELHVFDCAVWWEAFQRAWEVSDGVTM